MRKQKNRHLFCLSTRSPGVWTRWGLALPLVLAAVVVETVSVATWQTACPVAYAAEVELAVDAPQALSPEESRKLFRLPPGFHIELVAAEPHVADPVAMAFDARGRMFVCEIHGYNLEGYYDVAELNKTGVLDKAVRRIPARPEAIKRAEEGQYGTVKILEDTDGDGRIDRSSILADHLPPCYGVVPAREGVIVLCAPDIVYLADRDGDGSAEVRETLFTGFGVGELWTRINNPRWAPDNWIYAVSGGGSGGTIRGPKLPEDVRLGSVCFRFKPDGSALEPASGRTHGFGQAVDDWGDRYLCTNQQHAMHVIPIPHRYLARNPYYAAPNLTANISSYGHPARVYPISRPDPWRRARAADPAWVRFYGEAEATANGYFTAASGQTIYQDAQFPEAFRGNHFSVDNAQNMIHRCLLTPKGVSYVARRPQEDEQTEFLTSPEQWFRPVNLRTGPEGALYVVDMYRDIIEDYSAIPRYLQQLYVKSLIAGAQYGRIWRIVADEASPVSPPNFTQTAAQNLVAHLSSDNYWWRSTAQRLLVERGDREALEPLEHLARKGETPQVRLHALYTLDGLEALTPTTVEDALKDSHFAVRMHALRLTDRWLDEEPLLRAKVVGMVNDKHPRVLLQLALTLGESKHEDAAKALSELARHHAHQPWMAPAILCSATDSADELLGTLLSGGPTPATSQPLLHSLASIVGARRDGAQLGRLLAIVAQERSEGSADTQVTCLKGLIEGLNRGRAKRTDAAAVAGLSQLLNDPDEEVHRLAVQVTGLLKLQDVPEMEALFAEACRFALDPDGAIPRRQQAITVLAAFPYSKWSAVAQEILDARQPLDVQLAAVRALSSTEESDVAEVLLDEFSSYTPKLREAVIQAVFLRQNRLPALLDALEDETVPLSSLDAVQRDHLRKSSDAKIAARADKLLTASLSEDRQRTLAKFQAALEGKRDAQQGKEVFAKHCLKCHKLGEEGYEVGPDLLTAKTRADETLISDVMDPSNQITVGYDNYTIVTEEGRIFTGVLVSETATGITLRKEEGVDQTVLRKDIDEMVASTVSMMPEKMDQEITPQELANLLAFLRQTLGSATGSSMASLTTLFDDDPAFIPLLREGKGQVRLERDDYFSGKVSLAVTPPQRFSASIRDWQYRIAENPGPGEFRYLRFAWKQQHGHGVMLELAADGHWPPADQARHRYYSGKNSSGWNAVRVSDQRPESWAVVTRDLWRDFGPFTLTGIAPTAMGGEALFDRIELLRSVDAADQP